MQDKIELAKVKAFYYQKVVELGNYEEANSYIQANDGNGWSSDFICDGELAWNCEEYRIKPETVMHKGGEYPKPCSDAGSIVGAILYKPSFSVDKDVLVAAAHKVGPIYSDQLIAGIIASKMYHLKESDAIAHAKVIYQIED